ncbi:MAG TPA: universal stress protein [Chitinophagaceae bacterium]
MNILFQHILLPVDFTINTEIAVKKAMELIEEREAVIHLLHVMSHATRAGNHPASASPGGLERETASVKLESWRNAIRETRPDLQVEIHLLNGKNIHNHIVQLAKITNPQLIIIGKHNYHNWFSFLNTVFPAKMAKQTGCPVLTLKAGSLHNKIKTIVFPISGFVPKRKIELLQKLTLKYRARVYLVTLTEEPGRNDSNAYYAFIDTYRLLKSGLNCPIEHKVIPGNNLAKAALRFAEVIRADMILVTPDTETRVSLIQNKQLTDIVKADSKLEILAVEP